MKYLLLRNNQCLRLSCRFSNYRVTKQQFPDFKDRYCLKHETSFNSLTLVRNFSWTGFYTALSQSTPVIFLQNNLIELHQVTSLPWWSIIILTTLGIRSLIFPLAVHQNQVIARLANINSGMGKLASELNKEVNIARRIYEWDENHAKKVFRIQLKRLHNDLVVKNNCHPFKTYLLIMIQVPVWICFSVSLRNITSLSTMSNSGDDILDLNLQTEGILWFTDLTCPDPIFIPLILMFVNLSLIEIHSLRRLGKRTLLQKILLNSSRILSVAVAIAATVNPSSVALYWLCSSTFGIGQSLLLMAPKAKKFLRIPIVGKESSTPFTDIANNFKTRFKKK